MTEYIEREKVLSKAVPMEGCFSDMISAYDVILLPAADVAPVVHSRWAHFGGDEWGCPVCGFVITTEGSWDKPTKKYCENCGAKMDMRSTVNNNANKEIG